jgi:hypothetical protein
MGEYTHLTLAQLREKAKLSASPNAYSARSWLSNAQRTAAQAQTDDTAGDKERAFVGYLKALQFFQAFLEHAGRVFDEGKGVGGRVEGTRGRERRRDELGATESCADGLFDNRHESRGTRYLDGRKHRRSSRGTQGRGNASQSLDETIKSGHVIPSSRNLNTPINE